MPEDSPEQAGVLDGASLLAKFKLTENLPDLPASALRLCEAVDSGDASSLDLERIVLSDPAITASVLRVANSALFVSRGRKATSVKTAIIMLGQKAIRSVAVSVWVQSLVQQAKGSLWFDPGLFAQHSMFVGAMTKYLLAYNQRVRRLSSEWTPDELFAAGLLHDLGLGLLAAVEPDVYDGVFTVARARQLDFDGAFLEVSGLPIRELGLAAAQAWGLPDLFVQVLAYQDAPLEAPSEQPALCCVRYAEHLANRHGHSLYRWPVSLSLEAGVSELVGLEAAEVGTVVDLVAGHARGFAAAA